jgi:TolB-like protein/Tfp pilus assembly protein PilF
MSLFNELKRRNVFKVAAAYIIVGWLIMQAGDTLAPALHLPEWVNSLLVFFLLLGFPLALFFAWAFEMTPEGIKKEKDVDRTRSIAPVTGQKLNSAIIGLLVMALGYFIFDKFVLDPQRDAELVKTSQALSESIETAAISPLEHDSPDKRSIAVIPFINRSANEENAAFFSDGVHDELLTNLSRIHELKVISRTSVLSYRGTTKNLRQIGEELGVAHILEGGVQRAGDAVRINVQLIDTATDEHLWAEVYDRQLTAENIFAIQSEISRAIANALEATLSPREEQILATTPTSNLQAYDNLLIARQLLIRGNWQDLRDAQSYLKKAIELDPLFEQAYVSLANSYADMLETGAVVLKDVSEAWEEAIQTALNLDENDANANAAHARYLWLNGKAGVEQAYERARRLEPANGEIMQMYGQYLRKTFQLEKALPIYQLAWELDPVSIRNLSGLARIYQARGETDKALELFARIRQLDPSNPSGIGPTAGAYIEIGNLVEATRWLFRAMSLDPEDSDLSNWVVRTYTDLGDFDRARKWLSWTEQNQNLNPMALTNRAIFEVFEGNTDAAMQLGRQTLVNHAVDRWGSKTTAARAVLIGAINQGQANNALQLFRQVRPELFDTNPAIDGGNVLQAVDAAHLLQLSGQNDLASILLQAILAAYNVPYAISDGWVLTAKAQALALLGEKQAALTELRQQIDNGWRMLWRWETEFNPNFESLRDEPEFLAMIEFLSADMARQLEDVRAMEATGEIPLPPGVAAQ